jgi:hypothetical protein
MALTDNKNDPRLKQEMKSNQEGQNEIYLVLSDEELKKGFIRPVRNSYIHVGKNIDKSKMRPLTKNEHKQYDKYNYIGFIPNENSNSAVIGRFIKMSDLIPGCGAKTTMSLKIAETYARNPKFYGSTYCCGCQRHLPVEEFIWEDTNIRVGE